MLSSVLASAGQRPADTDSNKDWVCPMDPDVRMSKPGVCPRCGMKLVLQVPERVEYPLELSQSPELLRAGDTATLTFRVLNPETNRLVSRFEVVHEKLIHVFLVSENLEFFAHVHPVLQADGSFTLDVKLPYGGMYRVLADFYPSGSVPQLAVSTVFVQGEARPAKLNASLAPCKSSNLTAALRMEPEQPLAGLETRLFFTVRSSGGIGALSGRMGTHAGGEWGFDRHAAYSSVPDEPGRDSIQHHFSARGHVPHLDAVSTAGRSEYYGLHCPGEGALSRLR